MMYDIGIIGGMGSQATAILFELFVSHTVAQCDQDHPDFVILNRASIPDRTKYILDESDKNPYPYLVECVDELNRIGVKLIIIPCNTAHCFYDQLVSRSKVPILNMVDLSLSYIEYSKLPRKVCVLATLGIIHTGVYELFGHQRLQICYPDEKTCEEVQAIIYDIKNTMQADFGVLANRLAKVMADVRLKLGQQTFLFACTELSILDKQFFTEYSIVDAMDILMLLSIEAIGKKVIVGNLPYDTAVLSELRSLVKVD